LAVMGLLAKITGTSVPAVDDRGGGAGPVRLADVLAHAGEPGHPPNGLAVRLRHVVRRQAGNATLANIAVIIAAILLLTAAQTLARRFFPAGGFPLRAGIFLACLLGTMGVLRMLARGAVAGDLAGTLVAEGLCGGCGYRLESLEVAADGCLVCPECGAAWRAFRITRPCWAEPPLEDPFEVSWRGQYSRHSAWRRALGPDDRGRLTYTVDARLRPMSRTAKQRLGRQAREVRRTLRPLGRWWRYAFTALAILGFAGACAGVIATGPSWTDAWVFATLALICLLTALAA
jgi:hypothetical protein